MPVEPLAIRFEAIAALHPNRPAVVLGDRTLSYAELSAQANQIAYRLLLLELPGPSIVAIWLDRAPEMIVAMLGVVKAGHTYLPLEATYPTARILQTIEDARPSALIADKSPPKTPCWEGRRSAKAMP